MRTFSLVPACSTSSLGRRGTVDGIFCFSPRSLCLSLYDRPVQPATTYLGHFTFCFSPRSLCLSLYDRPVQPATTYLGHFTFCFSPRSLCVSVPSHYVSVPSHYVSVPSHYVSDPSLFVVIFYDRLVKPAAKSHFTFCFSPKLFCVSVPNHFVF